jgi:hypothetical protein
MKKCIIPGFFTVLLALSALIPATAYATQAAFTNNSGMSTWTLEAEESNLAATITLVCPLTIDAAGTFTDPTTGSYYIENDSIFPIHVSNLKSVNDAAWNNVAQSGFLGSTNKNVYWAKINPNQGTAGTTIDINNLDSAPTSGQWNIDAAGGDKEQLPIETTGAAKNITNEIAATPANIFTVTYTIARGTVSA